MDNDDNLIYKDEDSPINARIKNSLKNIDYDVLYSLDNNPLIVFKEFKNINDYNNEFKKLLNQIWNLNDVPILFISRPDQIEIYNANIFDVDESRLEIFKKIEDLNSFDVKDIVNGSFFKEYENRFNESKKVQDYLLDNITETKNSLSATGLPDSLIYALIANLILSKYLIDRKIIKYNNNEFYGIIENKKDLFNFFKEISIMYMLNQLLFKLCYLNKVK